MEFLSLSTPITPPTTITQLRVGVLSSFSRRKAVARNRKRKEEASKKTHRLCRHPIVPPLVHCVRWLRLERVATTFYTPAELGVGSRIMVQWSTRPVHTHAMADFFLLCVFGCPMAFVTEQSRRRTASSHTQPLTVDDRLTRIADHTHTPGDSIAGKIP